MKFLSFVRHRLQVKFLLLLLALLVSLAVVIILVFVFYETNNQRNSILNSAKAFSSLSVRPIGNTYSTYFDSGSLKFKEITDSTLALDTNVARFEIIDVSGKVLYDSANAEKAGNTTNQDDVISTLGNDKANYFSAKGETTRILEPYFDDFGAHPFSVLYFISYSSVEKAVVGTLPLIIFLTLSVLVLAALLVVFVVNRILIDPIEQIAQGASRVSSGQLNSRIMLESGDELQKLSEAVNNMAASLERNIEALKDLDRLKDEFIVIASHNLRTPVTVLKGYLAQLQTDSSGQFSEPISKMTVSVSQLEGLIEELLKIVSLERNKGTSSEQKVDLVTIIKEVISVYSKQALEKKVALHLVSPAEHYFVGGESAQLEVVFNNLIENAIKFNREGGSVEVKIDSGSAGIIVEVADSGIGINDNELPLVFKKFHRATDVLQYNYQGLGLGLYLAKIIVEAHRGKIWFESKLGQGSTFFVSLPEYSLEGGES